MAYQVIWDKNEGSRTGSLPSPTQGGTLETITILALYRDGTAIDLSAMTLSATMTDRDNNTTSVTGAFVGANGSFTWEFSAGDIGTSGRFDVIVTYTDGVDLWPSAPVKMDIIANPSATAVQNPALVGISTAKDAWLTVSEAGNVVTDIVSFNEAYAPTALEPVASMFWNGTDEEMNFVPDDDGTISMGKEVYEKMTNLSGVEAVNGDVVSAIGATGNRQAFTLTDATTEASARACVGMVTVPSIANNTPGRVTKIGRVRGLNTLAYAEGAIVYVDPANPGKLTDVEPTAGNYIIVVGTVTVSSATVGVISLAIRIIPKMSELSDVNGTALTTSGQINVWNQAANYWDPNYNITNYYPKTDFSASPTAAEPLKAAAGGIQLNPATASTKALVLKLAQNPVVPALQVLDYTGTEVCSINENTFYIGNLAGGRTQRLETYSLMTQTVADEEATVFNAYGTPTTATSRRYTGMTARLTFTSSNPSTTRDMSSFSAIYVNKNTSTTALVNIVKSQFQSSAVGTVASVKNFLVQSASITSGAVTTQYGFYCEPLTSGASNYAIYTNLGKNRFGDNVQIDVPTAGTIGQVIKLAATPTANAIEVQSSAAAIQFAIGPAGELKTNQDAANTNTPAGATAHQLPIYNEAGTLLGYIPIYGAAW